MEKFEILERYKGINKRVKELFLNKMYIVYVVEMLVVNWIHKLLQTE